MRKRAHHGHDGGGLVAGDGPQANATVCRGINAEGFFDLLTERIATLA